MPRSDSKPIRELQLLGTFRNDRHGKFLAPAGKLEVLEPQEHLTNSNAQVDRKKVFEYFANELYESGQSQKIDSILISQLVELYAIYVDAITLTHTCPDATMGPKKLAVDVAMSVGAEIRKIMSEFRLTPSTRGASESKKKQVREDPVGAFLEAKVVNK